MQGHFIDNSKYTGYDSHISKRIATKKPNNENYIQNNFFEANGKFPQRKVNALDNANRWVSNYDRDISNIKNFMSPNLNHNKNYHDDMQNIINDLDKNLNKKIDVQKDLKINAQYTTISKEDNNQLRKSIENIKSKKNNLMLYSFPDLYKNLNKQRATHNGRYDNEYKQSYGEFLDNPKEKFSRSIDYNNIRNLKNYYDGHEISKGSTKASHHLQNYAGFIPKNNYDRKNEEDVFELYKRNQKVIVLPQSLDKRIPGYAGFIPMNDILNSPLRNE